jgi:DNA-binding MarR family transcriptional regulator
MKIPRGSRTQTPAFDLEAFLPYRLAVLAADVSRAFSIVYADRYDLTVAEWRILANLGAVGPLLAGDIARRSNLDKPKVTRALHRLKARGLIVRVIDKSDRRQAEVRLSAAGQRMFRAIVPDAQAWASDLMQSLTVQQRLAFADCLSALAARLGASAG